MAATQQNQKGKKKKEKKKKRKTYHCKHTHTHTHILLAAPFIGAPGTFLKTTLKPLNLHEWKAATSASG